MPVTIIEAMMMSLPVISTRWRAIPDIVSDGEDGFLVPIKDSLALAEKLTQLIRSDKLMRTMGEKGRGKYLEYFTMEKHLASMEEVFKDVARE